MKLKHRKQYFPFVRRTIIVNISCFYFKDRHTHKVKSQLQNPFQKFTLQYWTLIHTFSHFHSWQLSAHIHTYYVLIVSPCFVSAFCQSLVSSYDQDIPLGIFLSLSRPLWTAPQTFPETSVEKLYPWENMYTYKVLLHTARNCYVKRTNKYHVLISELILYMSCTWIKK